jgi:LPS sulfotransferase NodH
LSQSDYSRTDQLLHHFALGMKFITSASFEMEALTSRSSVDSMNDKPIFIAGLARSGSTVLLNLIYGTGLFRSLTYRDMPFILMTGMWRRMSAGSQIKSGARERAHGDRLLIDYDSPEAFEEVFWRTFIGDSYIRQDSLLTHNVPASVQQEYRKFVSHVLGSAPNTDQARYLSKNNNNLLRLRSLKRLFPNSSVLIPFRDPEQQAISLYRQHMRFKERHVTDKFSKNYMSWLGHHEFGLCHKHYRYRDSESVYQPEDINYWLESWLDAYRFALENAPADAIFAGYESLCNAPAASVERLFAHLQIPGDTARGASFYARAESATVDGMQAKLLGDARDIYKLLQSRHNAVLAR